MSVRSRKQIQNFIVRSELTVLLAFVVCAISMCRMSRSSQSLMKVEPLNCGLSRAPTTQFKEIKVKQKLQFQLDVAAGIVIALLLDRRHGFQGA